MLFDWPFYVCTGICAIIGIVIPIFAPKGPDQGVIRSSLILTAVCCWLFWLCCYMAQMAPLIGPKLHNTTILIMAREWNGIVYEDPASS